MGRNNGFGQNRTETKTQAAKEKPTEDTDLKTEAAKRTERAIGAILEQINAVQAGDVDTVGVRITKTSVVIRRTENGVGQDVGEYEL